jgi:hypothetical protein
MTKFQKANRVDLAILDALNACVDPITLKAIESHVCAHARWVSFDNLARNVKALTVDGMITYSFHPSGGGVPLYAITCKGRAYIAASDTLAPVPDEPAADSARDNSGPEVPEAAQALLCVDEDELNDWWDALDVDAKADAFMQWSLGNDGRNSHVYIEPTAKGRIPVREVVS